MSNNLKLELSIVDKESDVAFFWELFNDYINELSLNATIGSEFDVDYFYSDEYRDVIEELRSRDINPLKIYFIQEAALIGFLMYVTYFDEGGKCFLMEYYIEPKYRNHGYGKLAYLQAEQLVRNEGALYIELTPTNEANERFWSRVGFEKSMDVDEDNKHYYRKSLKI
ncbi:MULTISPECIES: GNAT family N-acetyltransferase [unclassified Paenibacillus]|uniref:GNAT family N-acetyltransferase n=1 Tax=unclassified Paenibacillus TaxID=185978 RepID=UPI000838736F|nr:MULTISPECIES: GNAT family N-acetyltransferase [unclassified Paenibacillus]NWL88429.1 GNAT family N-acetyltransferase [Paenibacillus sp. 79R4]